MAHSGHAPESALFRFHAPERAGRYRGFFWFYFFNEHLLRFLNLRYPRDYNTVPRLYFWLFHLLWLFPWSVYLAGVDPRTAWRSRQRPRRADAAAGPVLGRIPAGVLHVLLHAGILFDAVLPGAGAADRQRASTAKSIGWIASGHTALAAVARWRPPVIAFILSQVWNLPAPGDISSALTQHPEAYTLSLGHMGDLTLDSFAYLRLPLCWRASVC